jgi:hypothetical protein
METETITQIHERILKCCIREIHNTVQQLLIKKFMYFTTKSVMYPVAFVNLTTNLYETSALNNITGELSIYECASVHNLSNSIYNKNCTLSFNTDLDFIRCINRIIQSGWQPIYISPPYCSSKK